MDDLKKVENLFDYNLKVKKLLSDIVPNPTDFYSDYDTFNYIEDLKDSLSKIETYINKMMLDYKIPHSVLISFNNQMKQLKRKVKSWSFKRITKQGYTATLDFISSNITYMRPEFVEAIYENFAAFHGCNENQVLKPITINEYSHFVHSYVINNETFYSSVPIVSSVKNDSKWKEVNLRGRESELGNQLYVAILNSSIESDRLEIINLDKKIIIMAKDLGHAAIIEIELTDKDKIFVKYFIPKNTSMEKMSLLKGIYTNKKGFATGSFQTTKDKIITDVCTLMQGIPTDKDIDLSKFRRAL